MKAYNLLSIVLLLLCACPPAPVPPPQPPDASDASPAPVPVGDASTPCVAACAALAAAGCPQGAVPDCATTLAHVDGARLVRTPSGTPLTCVAIAAVKAKADAQSLGVSCP